VLPFDNLSGDTAVVPLHARRARGDGDAADEARRVQGRFRTSALEYRNSTKSDREIASELGVVTLLRGTIQRSGGQVRFSVALADASQGKELWAESYDRAYTAENLFEVQGDIARRVAAALRVQLSAQQQQQLAKAPTSDVAALDAYYRGLVAWHNRGIPSEDDQTIAQLERAVELDTSFVAAWSVLAQARSWMIRRWRGERYALGVGGGAARAGARAGLAGGHRRRGILPLLRARRLRGALADLSAADRLMPNASDILYAIGLLERRLGRWDDAVAHLQRAEALDPRNAQLVTNIGETFTLMRRFPDAQPAIERALALLPDHPRRTCRRSSRTPRWATRPERAPHCGTRPAPYRSRCDRSCRRSWRCSRTTTGWR
jgi:tetratricopeptide (TPR) repeat protein